MELRRCGSRFEITLTPQEEVEGTLKILAQHKKETIAGLSLHFRFGGSP
jgi:hypothetical protein